MRAIGAVGSALPSHGRGRRFESGIAHSFTPGPSGGFLFLPRAGARGRRSSEHRPLGVPGQLAVDPSRSGRPLVGPCRCAPHVVTPRHPAVVRPDAGASSNRGSVVFDDHAKIAAALTELLSAAGPRSVLSTRPRHRGPQTAGAGALRGRHRGRGHGRSPGCPADERAGASAVDAGDIFASSPVSPPSEPPAPPDPPREAWPMTAPSGVGAPDKAPEPLRWKSPEACSPETAKGR